MRFSVLMPLAALSLAAVAGCSDKPDPNSAYNQGPYGPQGQPPQGQWGQPQGQPPQGQWGQPPQGQWGQPPQGQPPQGQPPQGQPPQGPWGQPPQGQPPAQGGGQAQPVAPPLSLGLQAAIQQAGPAQAPGMKPVGSALMGNFQAGQTLEMPFDAEPGACYTVVGYSLGPTDASIVMQPQAGAIPGATFQSQEPGPNPVLGKGNCVRPIPMAMPGMPIPAMPMKIILRVNAGSGLSGAQLYKK
jgi:hypothetical protein